MTVEILQSRFAPISPEREMGAYEALWMDSKQSSFKRIADIFRNNPGALPSDFVQLEDRIQKAIRDVYARIERTNIKHFGVRIHGSLDYPKKLRDAANPIELFYYAGDWDLINNKKRIAIVGSRQASLEGIKRTRKLTRMLVEDGFTIVSGLARGVDTAAHTAAIEFGGKTIAVIGTPITEYYPPENRELQDLIASKYLLISQIPILKYLSQDYRINRGYFPERNITMSALTEATVIVEAGNTSGSLTQARAAINQGRKLFILDSCFNNPDIDWPQKYEAQGAVRVKDLKDISEALKDEPTP